MRRLLPDPGPTSLAEEIAAVDLVAGATAERPYVATNFVLTLDGRATIEGRAGPIGSEVDTELLVGLRTRADAVMIGAGTMRAERYGRAVSDPAKREARQRAGLRPDPLMVLVSGRLDLPWDAPLFTAGAGEVVVLTGSAGDAPPTETPVELWRYEGKVDLAAALGRLRRERRVRGLLCEGGPLLHAELIAAGLLDELFVTHSPKLAGGQGPMLVTGLPEAERDLELVSLLLAEETGELFARYRPA